MNKSVFKLDNQVNLKRDTLICVLLAVMILAVYGQVLNHQFVNYDDDMYVTENVHVQNGMTWEGAKWAFSFNNVVYLHPLAWLSHMLDVQLFGMEPGWHHLTNVLFHIVNSMLLFLVFNRMTGAAWRSAFVAMLFAIHPINVESVAWVAERKSVLSTLFWMLTLWSYIRYVEHPGIMRYLWVLLFFILGLLAKPMLVTLPFFLLLLDYWPLGRIESQRHSPVDKQKAKDGIFLTFQTNIPHRLIFEKLPFFAFSLISIFLSSLSAQRLGIGVSYEVNPIGLRIANAMVSYIKYLGKIFWPLKLAFIYPYPQTIPAWQVVGAVLLLLCLTIMLLLKIRRAPFGGVGWLWYLGALVPVIGLVQAGFWPAMADRFAYIPAIGIFIIIVWGGSELVRNWYQGKTVLSAAAVIILMLLMAVTWAQVDIWRNSTTLFKHAIKVTQNNYMVHNNLGNIYFNQGLLDEAIKQYSEALRINPAFALTHNNLGAAMLRSGKIEGAIFHFRKATILEPGNPDAQRNLLKTLKLRNLTLENQ
jgi:hypothetical protein